MSEQELRTAARRHPFEPFTVVLTTGDRYPIRHPDLIMVGRRTAIIGMTDDPGEPGYERTIKVDLLHIVVIEDLPVHPSSTNGPPS